MAYPFPSNINVANFVSIKLDDNNFLLWETQISSLIKCQDLFGFVTGETKAPSQLLEAEKEPKLNPSYTSWVRTDRLVKSWIVGTLFESVLGLVVGLKTAEQVWRALDNHFTQSSVACEFDLLSQLQHVAKGNKPLSTYLREFKLICDQLNAIGKPVPDETKVFRLLEGLGDRYESFTTSMLRPPLPSFAEIVHQLQSYELRTKKFLNASPNPSMAFMSQLTTRVQTLSTLHKVVSNTNSNKSCR